jgi:hypothetical protein
MSVEYRVRFVAQSHEAAVGGGGTDDLPRRAERDECDARPRKGSDSKWHVKTLTVPPRRIGDSIVSSMT